MCSMEADFQLSPNIKASLITQFPRTQDFLLVYKAFPAVLSGVVLMTTGGGAWR